MMRIKTWIPVTVVWCCSLLMSCDKSENELTDVVLYNPFEAGNGVELMQIDSIQKLGGSNPYLKAYFSINYEYFDDTTDIDRVVLYRDDVEKAVLSPGNQSFFVDNSVAIGDTYFYQLSLIMDDGSKTKRTTSFEVVY
jgi:hypothetical protein